MYSSSFVVVVAILLVGARRSRGHIVREVEVVGHKIFPVGYSFTEGNETRVVSEISACAFVSDDEAVLVGDSGELFGARISEGLEIEFLWQKGLEIPGWEWVDAEGLAFTNDGRLFVSHEYHDKHSVGKSPLGVTQFNLTTGMAIDFGKMEYPTEGLPSNKGFEALAATSTFSPEKERLVTTAEDLDPHILLTFDVDGGVAREESAKYEASRLELSGTKLSVVEFASLLDQSLLVLERTFETYNTIRLFEFHNDSKRLVFEWNENGLNAANSASYPNLKVDNYEAMCLFPRQNQTTLLLVNDDNGNDSQIGTQFVAMRLFLEDSGEGEELSFPAPPTPAPTILRDSRKGETTLLWLIPMCVFTVIGLTACACGTRKPPVVIDEAGDQIELSHDVSNHRKAEGGADFTRVALDADDGLTPEPRDTQLV